MLRRITAVLNKRQKDITLHGDVAAQVRQAIQRYLHEAYSDSEPCVVVGYDTREGVVTLTAPSKALAAELMMNTREIRAHLLASDIRVTRIIAR